MPQYAPMEIRRSTFLSFHLLAAAFAIITYIFNTFTLNNLYYKRKTTPKSNTLILALSWHFVFSIMALIHCTYMSFYLLDVVKEYPHFMFWSGNLTYSTEITIGICNLFVAIDRLSAMCWPVQYHQTHNSGLRNFALVVTIVVCVLFEAAFAINRSLEAPENALAFIELININVVQVLHWFDAIVSIANVMITLVFLYELYKFIAKTRSHSTEHCENTAKVNDLVYAQLLAEVFVISIPILVTSIYNFV
ncbi:hypothetical protein L596_026587 [Steinernema carpocapsae]|uniref:G-protein coupled receptors family 1 profile domain-containing protein n=1 Tax=Steinernema carpocapsae TaxID=34508 RepID=A0A4U5M1V1_STECR|nr:hypothetical protein L596_026587 [Steinernema carpocapsae]